MPHTRRLLLRASLHHHRRCLRGDASNPDLTASARLALVRDRGVRIREIERELEGIGAQME